MLAFLKKENSQFVNKMFFFNEIFVTILIQLYYKELLHDDENDENIQSIN